VVSKEDKTCALIILSYNIIL